MTGVQTCALPIYPRDIYLLEKLYYPIKYGSYNNDSAEVFCKKFKYVRESGDPKKSTSEHIHFLQFEDFLFDYERVVKEVEEATGLKAENHVDKFKYLNPMRSINNVQVWLEHPELAEDIGYIEKELSEYLYSFGKHTKEKIVGIPVTDKQKF